MFLAYRRYSSQALIQSTWQARVALAQYAKGTPDYEEQRQTVADIESKIEKQVQKLSEITTAKKCGAEEASVTSPFRSERTRAS